jgi:Flp pilus assembly protein TadB
MLRRRRENKTAQKLPDVLELVNVTARGGEVK